MDGFLNNSNDSTIIHLSRTTELSEDYTVDRNGEFNAHMTVEDEAGNTVYTFVPVNNKGLYTIPGMNLDENKKYRLRIHTTDGNEYVSDDIPVKKNPPIDSISWLRADNGVTIYSNTHDAENNTKYYRWEYSETWDYSTYYFSEIKYVVDTPAPDYVKIRDQNELINHCWKTLNSKNILLASTVKLSADIISLNPVRFIPLNSFELTFTYSILVKQYALTREAFEYYELLKKFTEQFGSIFDSQPSQLGGNIHCLTNKDASVIGYITATNLQSKRIYITNDQVAPWKEDVYCEPVHIAPPDSFRYYFSSLLPDGQNPPRRTPLEAIYNSLGEMTGIKSGYNICSDCLSRGGINSKPDFWP